MHSKVKTEKINCCIHPAYLNALKTNRAKTGQSFGFTIEKALQKLLKVKTAPGTRQQRGRKKKKGRRK